MPSRIVEVRRGLLERNDLAAARLRGRFERSGTLAVNLLSSPGTGKTALLERLLAAGTRNAALVGDCATDRDAQRLARSGAPVRQIVTDGCCHLGAETVEAHLVGWHLDEIDTLYVENVGNLVCPADYDLGESVRIVLLAVTEGEDKPLKYPQMFATADLVVVTKTDLAEAAGFDRGATLGNLDAVRPGVLVVDTSARTGAGLADLAAALSTFRPRPRPVQAVRPAQV